VEEHRLMVFKNRALKRIFLPKRKGVAKAREKFA
jgi:hypothetical protein